MFYLPRGEQCAQTGIAQTFFLLPVSLEVERKPFVIDESAGTSELPQQADLFAVRHHFEFVGLQSQHSASMLWPMVNVNDFRHGRHCVSAMHVHLVFVTKYRRCSFDGEAIEQLRHIFSKVCTDFEAQLVQLEGEGNHVHLLVNYPPKVSASSLVNSLKGVSSYVLRRRLPRIAKCYWKNVLRSPSYFAASCGGAPLEVIKRYIEEQATPL
jgi:putative transposase